MLLFIFACVFLLQIFQWDNQKFTSSLVDTMPGFLDCLTTCCICKYEHYIINVQHPRYAKYERNYIFIWYIWDLALLLPSLGAVQLDKLCLTVHKQQKVSIWQQISKLINEDTKSELKTWKAFLLLSAILWLNLTQSLLWSQFVWRTLC